MRSLLLALSLTLIAGCATSQTPTPRPEVTRAIPLHPNETPQLRASINRWADYYDLPRRLVHRLAKRESTHNPEARNGPYYGLLQILPATARSMGFDGQPRDLLDPDTNLEYALAYLSGAYMVADGDPDRAIRLYAKGYHKEAKEAGLLDETGLR